MLGSDHDRLVSGLDLVEQMLRVGVQALDVRARALRQPMDRPRADRIEPLDSAQVDMLDFTVICCQPLGQIAEFRERQTTGEAEGAAGRIVGKGSWSTHPRLSMGDYDWIGNNL